MRASWICVACWVRRSIRATWISVCKVSAACTDMSVRLVLSVVRLSVTTARSDPWNPNELGPEEALQVRDDALIELHGSSADLPSAPGPEL